VAVVEPKIFPVPELDHEPVKFPSKTQFEITKLVPELVAKVIPAEFP
jgi:hypothetical protein